jgi:CRISPR/Cas system-associated exonuclease Cas4 (RecB family)
MCPLQYQYGFMLGLPRRDNCSLSFGKPIHQTLYHFVQVHVEYRLKKQNDLFGQNKSLEYNGQERLLDLYQRLWIDDWYRDEKEKEEYRTAGRQALLNFLEDFQESKDFVKALEMPFKFKINGVEIAGKIDRVDLTPNGLEILDYKTGRNKKEASIDKDQLVLYQIALEQLFDEKIEKLTYYFLEDKKKFSFLGQEKDKEKLRDKIRVAIDSITRGDFSAKPGRHCEYCDFKSICDYREGE